MQGGGGCVGAGVGGGGTVGASVKTLEHALA